MARLSDRHERLLSKLENECIEIFERTYSENEKDGWIDDTGQVEPSGWYAWHCMPGCLPDGEPIYCGTGMAEAIEGAAGFFLD